MQFSDLTREDLIREISRLEEALHQAGTRLATEQKEHELTRHLLDEMDRKLKCFGGISTILSNTVFLTEEVMEKLARIISPAFSLPLPAEVSMVIGNTAIKTPGFELLVHRMTCDIMVSGEKNGEIAVGYPVPAGEGSDCRFSESDGSILSGIAERLGHYAAKNKLSSEWALSERMYRNLVENLNEALFEIDAKGIIRYISPTIEKLLGYKPSQVIGKPFLYFVGENAEYLAGRFALLMEKGEITHDYKIQSSTGEQHWIRFSTKAIIQDGVFAGGTGLLTDITEMKLAEIALQKSESLYRSFILASPDVVTITDLQGKIRFVSPKAKELFGLEHPEETLGHSILEFLTEGDRPKGLRNLGEMFNGNIRGAEEYSGLKSDGTVVDIEVNGEFIYNEDGSPGGLIFVIRDVSESRRSRKEIGRLSSAVEQSPVSIVITNLDGDIEYANPKAVETTGYTLEELKGNNPRVLKSGETEPNEYDLLWKTISSGTTWKGIFHNRKKNGELYWESSQISPIVDQDGNITSYLAIKEDITEQKKTDEALKESVSRFRQLAELSGTVIWEVDAVGLFTYVNDNCLPVWGYHPEEIVGKLHFYDLHPEEGRKEFKEGALAIFEKNESFNALPNQVVRKDGRVIWVSTNGIPVLDYQGNLDGYRGADNDITERMLAQEDLVRQNERLNAVIKAIPDLMFVLDRDGIFREYCVADPTGLHVAAEQIIGSNLAIIFDEATARNHLLKINRCLRENRLIVFEYELKDNKGTAYCEARLAPMGSDRVLSFVRDITERKNSELAIRNLNANLEIKIAERTVELAQTNRNLLQEIEERKIMEEHLREARITADKANVAKSEFLSRMSHELRTPMNSILGFAQLLNMSELNPPQKKGVGHILKSGQHLLGLINEVLDISRIEAGRLSLSLEPVSLKGLLEELADIFRPQAMEKNVTIYLEEIPGSKQHVLADIQRLRQVLMNIVSNAIKYNYEGGSVKISADFISQADSNYKAVRICVRDTGIGLSKEDLPRIFNPFERVGAEKTTTEGTGLGLAVVKKLVDAMGGIVGVDSVPGQGSAFWVELPVKNPVNQLDGLEAESELPPADEDSRLGTILYVEDNLANIELVEQIIRSQRKNLQMVSCSLGQKALELAVARQPDLVLLDLDLPDINGQEVMERLKRDKRTREIPVVIISADAMMHQYDKLMQAGAKHYISKPLKINEFIRIVDEVIG